MLATSTKPAQRFRGVSRFGVRVEFRAAADGNPMVRHAVAQFYGIENDRGEMFYRGTFARSVAEAVPANRIKVTDGHYDNRASSVIARVIAAQETDTGLECDILFADTPDARAALQKVDGKFVEDLSIEFRSINERMVPMEGYAQRQVLEAQWCGLALLPYSSQDQPAIREARGRLALPCHELALAPLATAWDEKAARARILSWASSGERMKPSEKRGVDSALYGRAFALTGPTLASYGAPFADVVDGQLRAVPAGVAAAAETLMRERRDLHGSVVLEAMDNLDHYFAAAREAFGAAAPRAPWEARDAAALPVADEQNDTTINRVEGSATPAQEEQPDEDKEGADDSAMQYCAACPECGARPPQEVCSTCNAARQRKPMHTPPPGGQPLTPPDQRSRTAAVQGSKPAGPPTEAPTAEDSEREMRDRTRDLELLELELSQ
jgi:HK97 family phage prohead protease